MKTNVNVGNNYLRALNPDTYVVYHESKNKEITMNLTYKRLNTGYFFKYWNIAIPLAKVDGIVDFKNTRFKIDGNGYHDQNWGMDSLNPKWFWGEMGLIDKNISIIFFKSTYINRNYNGTQGRILIFNNESILTQINYPKMNVEKQNENEWRIYGEDGKYKINIIASEKIKKLFYNHYFIVAYYSGSVVEDNSIIYELKNVIGFFEDW
jgi:hypothetical protein